ncbi:hypothetical protein RSOLAG22IIIB_09961 [Rhizoctonia solani]|uniref:Uncharacterized protein n=1 Tax=Rhizoctonia solani TaxID=456999 RepID=A0A0K6G0R9_9AGAM|nr:hypothetical protein RSOLAG22IIIB_09961 [Rhizoctonia solani]
MIRTRSMNMAPTPTLNFECGTTTSPGRTLCSDNEESDWNYHYVSQFVDRDMLMRYLGGGIGHFNQSPPSEGVEHSTYSTVQGIDDEGEELDINQIWAETEDSIEVDTGNFDNSANAAGVVDSTANKDKWYKDDDMDGNDTGSDDELGDETDNEFIVDSYDF